MNYDIEIELLKEKTTNLEKLVIDLINSFNEFGNYEKYVRKIIPPQKKEIRKSRQKRKSQEITKLTGKG